MAAPIESFGYHKGTYITHGMGVKVLEDIVDMGPFANQLPFS